MIISHNPIQIKRHELPEMASMCEFIDVSEETRSRVLETKEEGLKRIGDIEVQARARIQSILLQIGFILRFRYRVILRK